MVLKPEDKNQIQSAYSKAGPFLNIGYFFIGGIGLFGYIGYKLDKYLEFKVLFLLLGLFLGLSLGFYNLFKVISNLENKSKDDPKDP